MLTPAENAKQKSALSKKAPSLKDWGLGGSVNQLPPV
jgi:hypothetical protein